MATTIGHLSVVIGAQTEPLQRDMNMAVKITTAGTQKMMTAEQQYQALLNKRAQAIMTNRRLEKDLAGMGLGKDKDKDSLWGHLFRGAFALAMFKRMVQTVRQGIESLKKAGDPDAAKAEAHMKRYNEGLEKFQGILAKMLAPMLGVIGDMLEGTANFLQNTIDAITAIGMKGSTQENFDRIKRERLEAKQAEKAKQAAAIEQREAFERMHKRMERLKPLFDGLLTPFDKFGNVMKDLDQVMMDVGDKAKIIANATDDLIKTLGVAPETTAFQTYLKNVDSLNALRRADRIEEAVHLQLLGQQFGKLAATQKELSSTPPEALIKGTAAAFSAINAFERGGSGKRDMAAILEQFRREEAEGRKEDIKVGREVRDELKKVLPIKVVGLP